MSETKCTREEVIAAIKGSGGIKTIIAQKLGVRRKTLYTYLRRWQTVADAYEEERQSFIDVAESVLMRNVRLALEEQQAGKIADTSDAKWVLSRLGKDRGYSERQEVDVTSGGDPIRVIGGVNLDDV